jgi:hypothetical protein
MSWPAARAYLEIQRILSDPALVAALGLVNVLVSDERFPATAGIDGPDLLPQLPAVIISSQNGDDQITASSPASDHLQFNIHVEFLRLIAAGENPALATPLALSSLISAIGTNWKSITIPEGTLYFTRATNVKGYDKQETAFWTDAGLPVAVGRFDMIIRAEVTN